MRCPDCNKFVSFDDPEVEVDSVDIADGFVNASVTVNLNCADCGTQLKTGTIETDVVVDIPEGHDGDGHDIEVEFDEAEGTSRSDGKPGTPSRYRRTFYGFSGTAKVTCSCGQMEIDVEVADDMQASSFDEAV